MTDKNEQTRIGGDPSQVMFDEVNNAITTALSKLGYDAICVGMVHWNTQHDCGVGQFSLALKRQTYRGQK